MKLKYYLRGLGIGVVVTAIIMSITSKPVELTDAQIKMRAAELGMVEESVLADLQAKEDASNIDAVEEMLNEFSEESDVVSSEEENSEQAAEETDTINVEEKTPTEETALEQSTQETEISNSEEGLPTEETESDTVEEIEEKAENTEVNVSTSGGAEIADEIVESFTVIKIERGNGSEVVSRRLYEAGLVESAVEYNQFLVKNGYDRRLSVGNHEIPAGATYDEMARILCGMK